jgi:5-formyltetrahydrofolate cyclo-ligase
MEYHEAEARKQQVRQEAMARRRRQDNIEPLSERILGRLCAMPEYISAAIIMLYVSFRSEVRTRPLFAAAWNDGKRVVVPYCTDDKLGLFALDSFEDLAPGTMGILEPHPELRGDKTRQVGADEVDLIVVPGVAFDRACGRIGYGKGYFDRLLRHVRPETALVAVAFECQIFPEVPMLPYDVRVDKIVTEAGVYVRSLPRWAEGS